MEQKKELCMFDGGYNMTDDNIQGFSDLEVLELYAPRVTNNALVQLLGRSSNMQELYLTECQMPKAGTTEISYLTKISELKYLKKLSLQCYTGITKEDITKILISCTQLEVLKLRFEVVEYLGLNGVGVKERGSCMVTFNKVQMANILGKGQHPGPQKEDIIVKPKPVIEEVAKKEKVADPEPVQEREVRDVLALHHKLYGKESKEPQCGFDHYRC